MTYEYRNNEEIKKELMNRLKEYEDYLYIIDNKIKYFTKKDNTNFAILSKNFSKNIEIFFSWSNNDIIDKLEIKDNNKDNNFILFTLYKPYNFDYSHLDEVEQVKKIINDNRDIIVEKINEYKKTLSTIDKRLEEINKLTNEFNSKIKNLINDNDKHIINDMIRYKIRFNQ